MNESMIAVEVANRQSRHSISAQQLACAVRTVLRGEGISPAEVSVAVVDDAEIHAINRQFLRHDYPTDVITFTLSEEAEPLEGEIVVSADTAAREALDIGWPTDHELLLYVVHGALHLAGYEDSTDEQRQQMRDLESHYLLQLEVAPPQTATQRAFNRPR